MHTTYQQRILDHLQRVIKNLMRVSHRCDVGGLEIILSPWLQNDADISEVALQVNSGVLVSVSSKYVVHRD